MKWTTINSQSDLDTLNRSVCWEDSEVIEFYGTQKNERFFPADVSRSGYTNKNVYILCRSDSKMGCYLEMVFIDCDYFGSRFLDSVFLSGRVDSLKRIEISDFKGATLMRCSRMIFRFIAEDAVVSGEYYRHGTRAEPGAVGNEGHHGAD